jgi:hypothetical protein
MELPLAFALAASLGLHVFQFYQLKKTKTAKRPLDISAQELLRDLISTGAVVRIDRIDPDSLLLWRNNH